ncbi:MAG: hypothetical protein KGS48_17015 [Bacteroidetes bacterium]|nr:hypothetical protein [Bacteroidota bacterium]
MDNRSKSIETALVITTGLLVLYFWTHFIWMLRIAMLVSAVGVLWPRGAAWIHRGWMLLAEGLGWFNSRVLLSVLFYVVLTPFALLSRLFGSSGIVLKRKPAGETYYAVRDHVYDKSDLENLW